MKRALFSIFMLLALLGCEKETANINDDRLVGTKWQAEDYMYAALFGGECFNVLEFISTSEVEHYITRNGTIDYFKGTHSYTLDYPKIIIHYNNEDEGVIEDYEFVFENSRVMTEVSQSFLLSEYIRQ